MTGASEPSNAARGLCAGKVALVTGAASGIGRACAVALAREGAANASTVDLEDSRQAAMKALNERLGASALE